MKGAEDQARSLFGISLSDRPKWQQFLICSSGFFFGYLVNGICEVNLIMLIVISVRFPDSIYLYLFFCVCLCFHFIFVNELSFSLLGFFFLFLILDYSVLGLIPNSEWRCFSLCLSDSALRVFRPHFPISVYWLISSICNFMVNLKFWSDTGWLTKKIMFFSNRNMCIIGFSSGLSKFLIL